MDVPQPTRSRTTGQKIKEAVFAHLIIILMVLALTIGVVVGLTVRQLEGWEHYQKRKIFYLKFPGDLLMNMLKMLILPLIVSSIISSLASLNAKVSGRIGMRAVVYYMTTTISAIVLGIIMVLSIRPGERGSEDIHKTGHVEGQTPLDALLDVIRNCFPNNLIEAAFRMQSTVVEDFKYNLTIRNESTPTNESETYHSGYVEFSAASPEVTKRESTNVLGLVVFSIFFGCIVSSMGDAGKPLLDFFQALHVAVMKLTMLVIWYSPIGIVFLIATKLIEIEDPAEVFIQLGYYIMTVIVGLAIHAIIVLPTVFFVFTRKNPFKFARGMTKALLTAWGTASSAATIPVTMECLRDNNYVDFRIVKFVAPIGALVNIDGTALYEAVAAIFIAQVNGIDMDIGKVITVSLTATVAAIGGPGIPSAGLVTVAIVLTAVGLPTDDVALIVAVDWLLDRFRTAVNVLGDSFGAGIVEHLSKADLAQMDCGEDCVDATCDLCTDDDVKHVMENGVLDNTTSVTNEKEDAAK